MDAIRDYHASNILDIYQILDIYIIYQIYIIYNILDIYYIYISDREKQIPYDITYYMESKKWTNELT